MMATEQYEQAVYFYEKAYKNNPDDEDITQKLSFARSRLISENLIEVRMFRQSNLQVKAAKKLNQSLQKMEEWRIFADSAVKATINEEVQRAAIWLNSKLSNLAIQGNHNRFSYTLKQYRHIIDSGINTQVISKNQPKMLQLGKLQCQKMRRALSPNSYFYHEVWQSYCANFGGSQHYPLSHDPSRFSSPNITSSKLYISPDLGISRNIFELTLEQKLKDSLWFSEHSKNSLSIQLSGKINYSKKVHTHTFNFIHTAKKEIFEIIKDNKNSKAVKRKLVTIIPYEKTLKVKGQSHTESVSHNLSLTGKLHSNTINASEVRAQKVHQSYSHQAYFKKQNIHPLKPKFFNTETWFSNIGNESITKTQDLLDNAWVSYFCSQQPAFGLPAYEKTARCAQLLPNHPLVTSWVKNEFDLNYEELQVLLH